MEKAYRLIFVYPDGHIEEINQLFSKGQDALELGNSMLVQVRNTENIKGHRQPSGMDEFGFREDVEPYFMIVEIHNNKYHLVYESRYAK